MTVTSELPGALAAFVTLLAMFVQATAQVVGMVKGPSSVPRALRWTYRNQPASASGRFAWVLVGLVLIVVTQGVAIVATFFRPELGALDRGAFAAELVAAAAWTVFLLGRRPSE